MKDEQVLYVTSDMVKSIRSDIDFFRVLNARHLKFENIYVYDKVATFCEQLHISAVGNRLELTMTL